MKFFLILHLYGRTTHFHITKDNRILLLHPFSVSVSGRMPVSQYPVTRPTVRRNTVFNLLRMNTELLHIKWCVGMLLGSLIVLPLRATDTHPARGLPPHPSGHHRGHLHDR